MQETIKKQETVIARLEDLLENSVKSKERARDNNVEIDSLKEDIAKLHHMVKEASYGPMMENSELNRLRKETQSLETLLGDLKEETLARNNKGQNN